LHGSFRRVLTRGKGYANTMPMGSSGGSLDVVLCPDGAPSIDHRFDCCALPGRGVIHQETGKDSSVNWRHGDKRIERPMLSAHITSFLKLISAQLEETSRGVISLHHFHNVQCGIENILSLLEYNNDVVEKADQLSRRASSYITRHDLISLNVSDGDVSEDANRLRAAQEALAGFCLAVERSQPNSRIRTLGLA
jgi:hypothetical protein